MGKTFSTGLLTDGISQDSSNNIGIGGATSGTNKFEVSGSTKLNGNTAITDSLTVSSSANAIILPAGQTIGLGTAQIYTGTGGNSGNIFVQGAQTKLYADKVILEAATAAGVEVIGGTKLSGSFIVSGSATTIGTTVLSGSLNVSGSITSTSTITAQTLVVQTITSSVLYSSGSNIFGNSLSNTQTFTGSVGMTGSLNVIGGSVGIGTASPGQPLEIYSADGTGIRLKNLGSSDKRWDLVLSGNDFRINETGVAAAMTIKAGGNVGINTTSPTTKLTIDNSANLNTNHIDLVGFSSSGAKGHVGYFAGGLYLTSNYYYNGGQNNDTGSLGQGSIVIGSSPTVGASSITFALSDPGATSPSTKVTILSNGTVGIGTTPNTWNSTFNVLQIGTAVLSTNSPAYGYLSANFYNDAAGADRYIASGKAGVIAISNGEILFYNTNTSGTANAALTTTERMRITSAGKVGIQNTAPQGKLEVGIVNENTTAGGHFFTSFQIPVDTWSTVFLVPANNQWNAITEFTWTSAGDYNRSGAAYMRWAYESGAATLGVVYTLFNNSQNATATFRKSGNEIQIFITGGVADYYVQVRIQGSRAS